MIEQVIDNLKNQGIEINSMQIDLIKKINDAFYTNNKLAGKLKSNSSYKSGFYIWGDVGRGKTLIARSFFNYLKETKIAFHYIDFMQSIHDELSKLSNNKNPIDLVAKNLCNEYKIIFIDEFQVEDITDAMIVGKLLNKLVKMNVILLLTSNAHPDNLYKNGLQRQAFIETMKIIQKSLNIYKLEGITDYRARNIINSKNDNSYQVFNDENIFSLLKENFTYTVIKDNKFSVNLKHFSCKAYSNEFLWLSFNDFFREANGSRDYIEISKKNEWIFLSDFKICNDDSSDIIRRFISFIDICYKDKTRVKFFESEAVLNNLYTGEKLKLLWDRCCSRLHEMQTSEYLI